jgi:hypothetical protein
MKRAGQEPNNSTSTRAEPRESERFLVGKNSADQWVARDEYGRRGGIFTNQPDALHFARSEVGATPCAIVLVAQPLELFVRRGGGTVANDNSTIGARAHIRVRARPTRLWAQGDILIEQVEDSPVSSRSLRPPIGGALLVAEGEAAGHRHRIIGSVVMCCDGAQARSVPNGLYIAHLHVSSPNARLEHEEHAPIELEQGTYRIRRQRQLEPTDIDDHENFCVVED